MTDMSIVGPVTLDRIRDERVEWTGPGGVPYYAALAAVQMGCRVNVSTVLAKEHEDILLTELRKAGVDLRVSWSESSTMFVNSYLEGDDRSQELIAVARPIRPSDLNQDDTLLWYFGPLSRTDIAPDCFEAARERGGRLALDGQGLIRRVDGHRVLFGRNANFTAMLPTIDFLKLTERELYVATGNPALREAMMALVQNGAKDIVVTRGSAGSCIVANGRFFQIPSFPAAPLQDTTGCGDTYFAVYLCARLKDEEPEWAGRLAAAAAALKATRRGGLTATRSQIERLAKGA